MRIMYYSVMTQANSEKWFSYNNKGYFIMQELCTIRVPVNLEVLWKVIWLTAFSNPSGLVPNVKLTCPRNAVMDTRTELTCNVMSSTFATIKWFYNGQAITKRHVTVDIRSCNQTLKIKYAKTTDGGNYTCQVTNSEGSVTTSCLLEVKGKATPSIHELW